VDIIDLREAALAAAPRRIANRAVLALASGLPAIAWWPSCLVTAVLNHRIDAAVRAVHDSLHATPPLTAEKGSRACQ